MTTGKKRLLIIISIIIVIGIVIIVCNKNKKEILFKSNGQDESINQIYIYDDLDVFDNYKSNKKIGSIESDSWFDIIESKIDETDIWYKIKSNNIYGYIKGVDNYLNHVDEYITILKDKKVVNLFYDIGDDLSEFDEAFKKQNVQRYNIHFKRNYKLYYLLSKDKNAKATPVVTINNMVYDDYSPYYNELIKPNLESDEVSNILVNLNDNISSKVCLKDKKTYLDLDFYNKELKTYDDEIKELKTNLDKSLKLIEETGGFLTDEMFKKIADMTTDSSALETLKQRYILIDTYNRMKEKYESDIKLRTTLVNIQDSKDEVVEYVFKCN